ncbi:MAG TPA: iron ABC transporter permease [Candidatus Dorea intestinavium]|nr:iron ABC transporter permease [Candidatus Dorea intestinavium]
MKSKQEVKITREQSKGSRLFIIIDKLMIIVLIVAILLFILYPILCVVLRSVKTPTGISFSIYQELFGKNKKLLWNSVFVAFLAGVFSTLLSVAVASFVVFLKPKAKAIFSTFLLITMVSPPFVSSLAYIQLFGRRGSITHGLLGLSLNPYGFIGVVIMQTIYFSSLNALLLIGLLDRVDGNLLQASKDLGGKNSSTYRLVLLPLIKPAIFVCFLLSFIRSMADYGTPVVIGGRYENLATAIYMQLVGFSNLEKSAAMNVLLLVPAIIVFIFYRYLMKKNERWLARENSEAKVEKAEYRPGGFIGFLIIALSLLFYSVMTLQYGSIFLNSFSKLKKGKRHFSLEPFQNMMNRSADTFIRSITYALIVALVGSLIGILLSYYIDRRKIYLGSFWDFVVTIPYMIPGSCFGIGYILAFNSLPLKLTGTAVIVVLNMIFKQLSITTKVTSASLTQLSTELDLAAADLGATKPQILKDIILPNIKNAFMVGFVNNFTSAMVTAGAVIFLVTPGQKIAVFTLFDAINTGKYAEASMISTVLIFCTVVVNLLFIGLTKGKKKGAPYVSNIG